MKLIHCIIAVALLLGVEVPAYSSTQFVVCVPVRPCGPGGGPYPPLPPPCPYRHCPV